MTSEPREKRVAKYCILHFRQQHAQSSEHVYSSKHDSCLTTKMWSAWKTLRVVHHFKVESMALEQPCFNCDQKCRTFKSQYSFLPISPPSIGGTGGAMHLCHGLGCMLGHPYIRAMVWVHPCICVMVVLLTYILVCQNPCVRNWYVLHCRLCFWQHGYPVETLIIKNSNRWQWEIGDVTMS